MRQITTDQWHRLRLDLGRNISLGHTWNYGYSLTVPAGGTEVLRLSTSIRPVALFGFNLTSDGSRGVRVEYFVGGDVTPGVPVTGFPRNHDTPQPAPFVTADSESVVVAPGTKIGEVTADGSAYAIRIGPVAAITVLAPERVYYLDILNLNLQPADLRIDVTAGSLEARPPGL